MTTELRVRNPSQLLFTRAITAAWRNRVQLYDPSIWLGKEAELEEKILRDIDCAHVLSYRSMLVAGRDWNLTPKEEYHPRAPVAVMVGTKLIQFIEKFTEARYLLNRAILSGARFQQIHGGFIDLNLGDGLPRRWWVPIRLEDLDKRMFRIVPNKNGSGASRWERWSVSGGDWEELTRWDALHIIRHVYQDDQASLRHGRGLREALAWWWYAKEHVFADSLEAVERFAQGIIAAKVDGVRDSKTGLPNEQLIDAWTRVLEDLRSRHVLVYDKNDQVETIQMNAQGWQILSDFRQEIRSAIFTIGLGANLTTGANEGGSYALAGIQENSTESIVQYDRGSMEETYSNDLLRCIWRRNYANLRELGIYDQMPLFNVKQEKRTDPQVRATVGEIANRMGVDLALEDYLEQIGFRKPEPGERVIKGGTAQPTGAGGFPSGLPFVER